MPKCRSFIGHDLADATRNLVELPSVHGHIQSIASDTEIALMAWCIRPGQNVPGQIRTNQDRSKAPPDVGSIRIYALNMSLVRAFANNGTVGR